jgi:O-antigen/teichoic acid export membrane protein
MGIIAFAFAMQVLLTLLTAPLYSNKNIKSIFFSYLLGGTVNTILNFLLIPTMGILGAAISTAVSYFLVVVIFSYFNYTYAGFPFVEKRLIVLIGTFFTAWLGISYLREILNFYQILISDLFLLSFSGVLIYFKGIATDEKKHLLSFLKVFRLKKA